MVYESDEIVSVKIAVVPGQFLVSPHAFITNQIAWLCKLDHEVDILVSALPKKEFLGDIEQRILKKVFTITPPRDWRKRFLAGGKIIRELVRSDLKSLIDSLNFVKYRREALSLRNLFRFYHFLNHTYDILHCHFGDVAKKYVFLKNGISPFKLIVTFHGYDFTLIPQQYTSGFYKELFQKADLVTVGSTFAQKRLIALNCSPDKVIVLPMCVDLKKFTFKPKYLKSGEKIKILTVARLVEKKGLAFAIKAIARLIATYPNLEYKIIGDGPLRNELALLVGELKLGNIVSFAGEQSQRSVISAYQESHIFMLPSVTATNGDMESQSVVIAEAQAAGLPVIATYHDGIPESIEENKSGFLVPEKNVEALAAKLQFLFDNPNLWPKMGRMGRKYVEHKFDCSKTCTRLVEIYESLLRNKNN